MTTFRDTRPAYPPEYDLPDAPIRCAICGRYLSNSNTTGACGPPRNCHDELAEQQARIDREESDAYVSDLDEAKAYQFSESEAGRRGLDTWARAYDELNGAPEGDDDR